MKVARHSSTHLSRRFLLLLALLATSCGWITTETVDADDPRLQPLLEAIKRRSDRAQLGFTPLPSKSEVPRYGVEWTPKFGYDAMIHVNGETARTIAFKRTTNGYEWLGEQEKFYGPGSLDTPDGRVRESVTITFHCPPMQGQAGLWVSYTGRRSEARHAGPLPSRGRAVAEEVGLSVTISRPGSPGDFYFFYILISVNQEK